MKLKKIVSAAFALCLLSALTLFAMDSLGLQRAYAAPYTDIDVETAYNMITNGSFPNLVVLDVRNQSDYESEHLDDAILIPVQELEARIDELARHMDHEIIVYCKTGIKSEDACDILDSHNFTKVYNMLGGITAWKNNEYPVIQEFPMWTLISLILIVLAVAVAIYKWRPTKTPIR